MTFTKHFIFLQVIRVPGYTVGMLLADAGRKTEECVCCGEESPLITLFISNALFSSITVNNEPFIERYCCKMLPALHFTTFWYNVHCFWHLQYGFVMDPLWKGAKTPYHRKKTIFSRQCCRECVSQITPAACYNLVQITTYSLSLVALTAHFPRYVTSAMASQTVQLST